MKYTNGSGWVEEKHTIPFKINVKSFLIALSFWTPSIICLILAQLTGWTDGSDPDGDRISNAALFACILGIVSIWIAIWYSIEAEKPPVESKNAKFFNVNNFKPEYLHLEPYKEAYDDLIDEIKRGDHTENGWSDVFASLNKEAERFIREEKRLKQKITPRKDYAAHLKDFNDTYFGSTNV